MKSLVERIKGLSLEAMLAETETAKAEADVVVATWKNVLMDEVFLRAKTLTRDEPIPMTLVELQLLRLATLNEHNIDWLMVEPDRWEDMKVIGRPVRIIEPHSSGA